MQSMAVEGALHILSCRLIRAALSIWKDEKTRLRKKSAFRKAEREKWLTLIAVTQAHPLTLPSTFLDFEELVAFPSIALEFDPRGER